MEIFILTDWDKEIYYKSDLDAIYIGEYRTVISLTFNPLQTVCRNLPSTVNKPEDKTKDFRTQSTLQYNESHFDLIPNLAISPNHWLIAVLK